MTIGMRGSHGRDASRRGVRLAVLLWGVGSLLGCSARPGATPEVSPEASPEATAERPPVQPPPTTRKPLDFAAHLRKLRGKLPSADFHVVVQKPFVVIGDESKEQVKRRALRTIKWSVDLLKKAYFAKDPDHIIDIWLFKDKASYRKHTKELFGHNPSTPFGYYSSSERALIMNIATGGGTLVHEIVHPFVAANFPNCPAWFNEGLGSLYEQCRERDGRIVGLTNWRLAGLQKAIRVGTVPRFETLLGTTEHDFYNRDRGTNYSQARYLCYYLQEKGLLRKYYKAFFAAREKDPTGYQTLVAILGRPDMDRFQAQWQEYVSKLRFN